MTADPEHQKESHRALSILDEYNRSAVTEREERKRLLRKLLGHFGDDVEIRPPFFCEYGSRVSIGARTLLNFGVVALDVADIKIGDDVQIGSNVQLLTVTNPRDGAKPISIGNKVWLGGGVIVCAGVSIGDNTVVSAGAVVTESLPANVLAAGNPARVVKPL